MKMIISITFIFCILYAGAVQDTVKALPESANSWNEFWDNLEASKNNFGVSAEKTILYGNKALEIARIWNDTVNISIAKLYIAAGYEYSGEYDSSLNYYLGALNVFIEKNRPIDEAYVYDNIGLLYLNFKDADQAIEYFYKAKVIYENLNNDQKLALILNHIGLAEEIDGNLIQARKSFEKAIGICLDIKNYELLSALYHNLGKIYLDKKKYEEAERLYRLSAELMTEIGSKSALAINYLNFAYLYLVNGELSKVEKYLIDAEKLIVESGTNNLLADVYYDYYLYFDRINNHKKSLIYLKKYNTVKNVISSSEQRGEFDKLLTDYIINNKNTEINKLKTDKDTFWTKLNYFKFLGIILLFVLLGAVLIIIKMKINILHSETIQNIGTGSKKIINEITKKYTGSKLAQSKKKQIQAQIIYLIEEEKIFTQNGLTLTDFAKKMKVSRTYVSQVINEKFNLTFNNFINQYRIEEAIRLLDSEEFKNHTIESIAEEVGFNSTNIFTKSFKQIKGIYPSEYIKAGK